MGPGASHPTYRKLESHRGTVTLANRRQFTPAEIRARRSSEFLASPSPLTFFVNALPRGLPLVVEARIFHSSLPVQELSEASDQAIQKHDLALKDSTSGISQ